MKIEKTISVSVKLEPVTVRRLTKLADFLETIPKNVFDMDSWFNNDSDEEEALPAYKDGTPKPAALKPEVFSRCGTTACALGWAATIPSFREAGLRLENSGWGDITVKYKGHETIEAAMEFFKIPEAVADQFFLPNGYEDGYNITNDGTSAVTPKAVSKNIRAFIADPVKYMDDRDITEEVYEELVVDDNRW